MTTYYCDLAEDFSNPANVGDTSGNPANGPGGYQSMINGWGNHDALAAGDTLLLTGTGDLSKFIKIIVTDDKSATWTIGDTIYNDSQGAYGAGERWQGVLVYIDATTVWVQIDAASTDISYFTAGDGVLNTTLPDAIADADTVSASAPGLLFDGADGTGLASISHIGVNSSWVEDGTRATLDGKGLVQYLVSSDNGRYYRVRNIYSISGYSGSGRSWKGLSSNARFWTWQNCVAEGGREGWGGFYYVSFVLCTAFDCEYYGFICTYSNYLFCTAYNNATGFYVHVGSAVGCVAYDNSSYGYSMVYAANLYNCVADNNYYGIKCPYDIQQLFGCRITNNTHGIHPTYACCDPYCFYGGNGTNWTIEPTDLVDGVSTRTISDVVADIGYVDPDCATLADRNYALTNSAAARRQAVTL
jgi:hypothetical protein